MKYPALILATSSLVLSACGGGGGGGGGGSSSNLATEAQMKAAAISAGQSLDADFASLKNSIDTLVDDIQKNCDGINVTEAEVETWQGQWNTAMSDWMALQYLSLGPLASSRRIQVWPTTLTAKTNTFPATSSKITAVLAGADDLAVEANWNRGREYQGLQALEYVLFTQDDDATKFTATERRCEYAKAAGAHLKVWAQDIIDGSQDIIAQHWQGSDGFEQNFANPGAASTPYASAKDLQQDWLTDYVSGFENLKKEKLEQPLGWDEGACLKSESSSDKTFKSLPEMVEAPFSQQSMSLAISQLEQLQQRFNDSYGELLTQLSPGLKTAIEKWFTQANAQKAVLSEVKLGAFIENYLVKDAQGNPKSAMDADVQAQYQALQKFHQAVRNLTTNFKTDLAALLDVTISFNAADGDSGRPTSTNCWPQ